MTTINIIGSGAYGTALSLAVQERDPDLILWSYDIPSDFTLEKGCYHSKRLEGILLPENIHLTDQLDDVLTADILLLAVPAQSMRSIAEKLKGHLNPNTYLVICSKGIENQTAKFMSEVIKEILPGQPVAALSGPSFALELAQQKPTAVTIAASDLTTAEWLCQSLMSPSFRTYASDDLIGVQVGGSVKNVIAIACGVVAAQKMGENTRALLLTRGLAEMIRLGLALGAKPETFQGLSGLGDLCLTCVSGASRNWTFGYQLGSGDNRDHLLSQAKQAIEGVKTCGAVMALAQNYQVRMPICEAVDAVVNRGADLKETLSNLLNKSAYSYLESEKN